MNRTYQPTAYNSRDFKRQPRPAENPGWSERMHRRGEKFGYSQVNDSIATSAIREQTPSLVNGDDNCLGQFWTHQRLEPYTFVRWAGFYFFIASMAKVALQFAYPFFVFLCVIISFSDAWTLWDVFDFFIEINLYIALPAIIIYSPILWLNWRDPQIDKEKVSLFARKRYTMNRETGMVTLYGEKNRVIFTHPFIEFDCILASNPNHQGLLSYQLMLMHRYHDYGQGINIGVMSGVNMPRAEYRRLWNMIQQYMDVSQPLPDIPMLEPFREQDETTVAYDKQTGRNPRYWREMTDEAFEQKITEIARIQREEDLPPTGPELNIFEPA
ncbi:hypothetical protein VA7868_01383 [Vibrio aerogenes CECT 7868]|uniref:Uncharacterized protein n=2 Tax=Vibrio aerogenes TaxID=92172 RepID=A0A1M5XZ35_9VIBR|nr:hypothetical protein VA7868_01383 [Vibrio aerogenes CECT 7868]